MTSTDTQAYVIAVNRRRVGVAVTAGQGFRFIAADPDFRPLDGSSFRHLIQLEQAAERLARAVGPVREGARRLSSPFERTGEWMVVGRCRPIIARPREQR